MTTKLSSFWCWSWLPPEVLKRGLATRCSPLIVIRFYESHILLHAIDCLKSCISHCRLLYTRCLICSWTSCIAFALYRHLLSENRSTNMHNSYMSLFQKLQRFLDLCLGPGWHSTNSGAFFLCTQMADQVLRNWRNPRKERTKHAFGSRLDWIMKSLVQVAAARLDALENDNMVEQVDEDSDDYVVSSDEDGTLMHAFRKSSQNWYSLRNCTVGFVPANDDGVFRTGRMTWRVHLF